MQFNGQSTVSLDASAEDGVYYTATLTSEALASLGESAEGTVSLLADGKTLSTQKQMFNIPEPPVHTHEYTYVDNKDGSTHTAACQGCDDTYVEEHTYVEDGKVSVCRFCGARKPSDIEEPDNPVFPDKPGNDWFTGFQNLVKAVKKIIKMLFDWDKWF